MNHIGAISLIVPDYDAAIAFFTKGVGWVVQEDIDQGRKRWVRVGPAGDAGSSLILAQADGPAQTAAIGQQGGGRVWLFLHTSDFDASYARLTKHGATFEEAARDEPYGRVAVFQDPWGNRWDLLQSTPLPEDH